MERDQSAVNVRRHRQNIHVVDVLERLRILDRDFIKQDKYHIAQLEQGVRKDQALLAQVQRLRLQLEEKVKNEKNVKCESYNLVVV